MLFDLRGRGRRRTVQVVYLGLALLFLLGFLGLGIGVGGGGGGILNFFTEEKSTGGASFAAKVEAAQARTHSHPSDPAAWAALAEAQLHQASEPEYIAVTNEREGFSAKGLQLLGRVSASWNAYLRLQPHRADAELAQRIASIYVEQGLNEPAEEAKALQVAIAGKAPSAGLYSTLAEAAYKARHISEGDVALKKALPLITSSAERTKEKKYLLEIRKNPLAHVPISLHKGANGTYVATQAGKTATVAPGKKPGTFTGIGNAKTATPPPAGHTTTAKK
jgi:hypothetical protein